MPWRVGAIKLDAGPTIMAHAHADAEEGARVRVLARTDKSGQGVFLALPEEETPNMADDKALRELTCDPKHRRILVTDVRRPTGQALVRGLLKAGAAKVFLGIAEQWKPFAGRDELCALPKTEVAPLDLSDADSVADLAGSIGGKVDILINTTQHVRPGSAMARRDAITARDEMELNYFGPLRLLQSFGPAMRSRGADGVNSAVAWVNVLSAFALANWPAYGLSSASQAAALSLSQCARGDFAGTGVKVVNIFHGPIDDEWHQPLPPPKLAPEVLAAGIVGALQQGIEQSFIGDVAKDIEARWREDPGLLERELSLAQLMD
jgi:NAD(P)-dependent dehydrogenase (short-subunit alcohol dehydrogenase family)